MPVFMSVNFNLALDLPPTVSQQWEPLLIATADNFLFYQHYSEPTRENVIEFMTFDKRNPNSIVSWSELRPRKCPDHPRNHLEGNVGAYQPALPHGARFGSESC